MAVHAAAPEVHQQASSVPIYQTSTWRFDSVAHFAEVIAFERPGQVYGRGYGNPTVGAFEAAMARLEGTEAAFAFDSGMAAIHAVLLTLTRSGDRIVASDRLYGGTHSLMEHVLPRYGIAVDFVDQRDTTALASALEGARLFYTETVSNPDLAVADLARLGELCRSSAVPAVIDNTFASPYLCRPYGYGFEYVVHSATKYIGGHSDLIGGVACSGATDRDAIRDMALELGSAMQPFEAWLALRGLATLALRMERHSATALRVAQMLAEHPAVASVHYPGLEHDPYHALAGRLLRHPGGMLSFEHRGGLEAAARFCDSLGTAWLAASLGGAHTLVTHPASTTHRQLDEASRRKAGVTDGLVRVSIGLEDAGDILADFEQALRA